MPLRRALHPSSYLAQFAGAFALTLLAFAPQSHADIDPLSGIDFVRVGAVGNAPWMGDGTLDDRAIGRGSVNYEYKIGRFEVTTAQWVEFFNAAFDRPANDRLPYISAPNFWGGQPTTPHTPGGMRWTAAGHEMIPTGNISWRTAAMYCNWLCNGKSLDRSAFMSGAYDVSTFGYIGNQFTDQPAHTPGAAYYIPSWDEWLKAVHFDPNRNGPDQPGWWTGPQSRDGIPAGGPPGTGTANWRDFPGWQSIPLGAYSQTSPWGLYDAAGATTEWTESIFPTLSERYRIFDGSFWGDNTSGVLDPISGWGGDFPSIPLYGYGLRIAASVPSPGACIPMMAAILLHAQFRRRRPYEVSKSTHNRGHHRHRTHINCQRTDHNR